MEMNLKKISSITLFTSFALGRARTRYFLRTTISPFNPSLKILISLYSILILFFLFILPIGFFNYSLVQSRFLSPQENISNPIILINDQEFLLCSS